MRVFSASDLGAVLGVVLVGFGAPALSQAVLPDGGTSTSFSLGPDGKITVDLAPADANSISHNTFERFSVPDAGVDLDNRSVGAGTIINEVTSANPTSITGALTVIGPQGHVIIANPNGITVDGGRFVNTGHVALTTGAMSFDASGRPVSTVGGGQIAIEGGGLSGTMAGLDLIAKSIRIGGGIGFDSGSPAGAVTVLAGDSIVNFDAGRAAGGLLPWALPEDTGSASGTSVLVDITRDGSIHAGRISLTVTDQGAGVRIAGDQLASEGGFRLSSTGALSIDGARIDAERSVNIRAGSVDMTDGPDGAPALVSQTSGVTVEAISGDITLGLAQISGDRIASDNLASAGGVTLISDGSITAAGTDEDRAGLASANSHVALFAGGDLDFTGTDVSAAGGFRLSAVGAVSFDDFTAQTGDDVFALAGGTIEFDAATLNADGAIRLDGTALRFGAEDPGQLRTELVSVTGGLTLRARSGDIVNNGGLLQGAFTIPGDADSLGAVSIHASGDFVNRSLSLDKLAVAFGQSDDLFIETGGDIRNLTGRLFSNEGITLRTGGDIVNETGVTGADSEFTLDTEAGSRFFESLFLLRRKTTRATADYGDFAIEGERALILGVGTVSLEAQSLANIGGEITGIDIDIDVTGVVENAARLLGSLRYKRTCRFFCKTSGSSDIRVVGGLLNASGALTITADETVRNIAGQFIGNEGITVTAPLTEFVPQPVFSFIERPMGLLGLFRGKHVWFTAEHDYGAMVAIGGEITIDGDAILGDARLVSTADPVITGSEIEAPQADFFFSTMRGPIGLLWALF